MSDPAAGQIQFTLTDIEVGCRLVEALVLHAQASGGAPIAYAEVLTLARSLHPKDATLGRQVPVGIGGKLAFVTACCRANGWPDLACLAVNGAAMRPAAAYSGDWDADRRAVARFDWAGVAEPLHAYAEAARAAVPRRLKPRKERPADVAWYAYFCSHREASGWITGEDKQEIINLLMAGLDPESAVRRVQNAKAELAGEA